MANKNIVFPIIRRLSIKGHALFPGKNRDGIDHVFERGVTVIAGINGIGKTTMLNLVYRLLVGPYDPLKADDGIQLTQTRLTELKNFTYFSRRDSAGSDSAIATGEFQFGIRKVSVTRRLSDLSILSLEIDGKTSVVSPDASPEFGIWSLSGCGSHYDFHLLMRTLVFFLESKTPVVWDPIAQAELFRILFLDALEATRLAQLASDIQQIDSRRRNLLNQLNRYKSQNVKSVDTSAAAEAEQRTRAIASRIEYIDSQLSSLTDSADSLERRKDSQRQKLESLKLDLEEATRHLEHIHHQYFGSLFPKLPEIARNVFLNLVGDSGCLVCGARHAGLSKRFQKLAADGACPVCLSEKDRQEPFVQASEFGSKTIENANEGIAILKQNIDELDRLTRRDGDDYHDVLRARISLQQEREGLLEEAGKLRLILPSSAEDRIRTENYIKVAENEISEYAREISGKMVEYTGGMNLFRSAVDLLRGNLAAYFGEYAASFLAEECNLTYKPQKLLLGQAVERVEYPTFAVQMTSAASPISGTTRTELDDVSESQKEFIDLAFRMAVLKAYAMNTGNRGYAMIVIETPEASLDSVFVANAGRMLRQWCIPDLNGESNSILASSNLNRENMIASLLGLRISGSSRNGVGNL